MIEKLPESMDLALKELEEYVKEYCAPPVDKDPWKSQFEESIRVLYELIQ